MKDYNLVELEEKEIPALKKIAVSLNIDDEEIADSSKHNLIYKILDIRP